jgi:hypothetical protein
MTETREGGCACGAVRYTLIGAPLFQNHCQCRQCQRIVGGGHASYLTVRRDAARVNGDAAQWAMIADSGFAKASVFCPRCGSPLYLALEALPDLLAFHVGGLDKPADFEPHVVTYAAGALPWDYLDPAIPRAATTPG